MKKWILFGGLIASIVLIYAFVSPRYLFAPEPVCHTGGLFERFDDPLSEEYQAAVREVLQGKTPADFRYFFRTFLEEEDGAYLLVNFRADGWCFDVRMLVDRWDKLAGMKKVNGRSYPEELHELEWELRRVGEEQEVAYVDMRRVID
ncbi:MAG: hypothetical protein KDC43_23795 [Saprospiraceae bacterium]|nr:hypothetical protein [Saprospiraceae bacterium]MCB0684244.1 hypothetical protein [Saprospiraceae bacterium]